MAKTLNQYRKSEDKFHENLHKNLCTLALVYTPTKDFEQHLKKGMFVKSNPIAFLHVMHFLLCIIDPVGFKSKFQWPLYDKSMEANFRTLLRTYLPDLNIKFPFGDIPPVKVSYMVTPGGYNFTRMIFKLSELALIVHLQKCPKSVYLKTCGKTESLSNNDSIDQERRTITDLLLKANARVNMKIAVRNKLYEDVDEQARLIRERILLTEQEIEKQKDKWKKYVLLIPDFIDQKYRQKIIDDPTSVISDLKSNVSCQMTRVENMSKALSDIAATYTELNDMADVLMMRREKGHYFEYNNELTNLMPLRKYVAEKDIPIVEKIVTNGQLNFPLLLHCLGSVFSQTVPLISPSKNDIRALSNISNNATLLSECLSQFKYLNEEVSVLRNELQISLDKARENFENNPQNSDSPVIASLTSLWPAESPYRNLKWFDGRIREDLTKHNLSEGRATSMIDVSVFSNTINQKNIKPTWLSSNIMSCRKARCKPSTEKSRYKYQSTPCLASPVCKINLASTKAFDSSTECSYKQDSSFKQLDTSVSRLDSSKNSTRNLNVYSPAHSYGQLLPATPKPLKYITPPKAQRRSIHKEPIKNNSVEKRLSYIAKEMPVPNFHKRNSIYSHNEDEDIDSSSINNSPLGFKASSDLHFSGISVTMGGLSPSATSLSLDPTKEDIPVCKLVSFNESMFDECSTATFNNNSCSMNFSKLAATRFSLGPLAKDFSDNLLNISNPQEFNLSVDSD